MKTPSLMGLGRVMAKIHPPLDRTPRQKQQLLRLLDKSFQDQLDKYHPPINSSREHDSQTSKPTDEGKGNTLSHAADQHLLDVLNFEPGKSSLFSKSTLCNVDPHERLKRAVGSGTVTQGLVTDCLREHMQQFNLTQCVPQPTAVPNTPMLDTIVDIIDALNSRDQLHWMTSRSLMLPLITQLRKEGKSLMTWKWLEQLIHGDLAPEVAKFSPAALRDVLKVTNMITRCTCDALICQGEVDAVIERSVILTKARYKNARLPPALGSIQRRVRLRAIGCILEWVVYHQGFLGPVPARLRQLLNGCDRDPRDRFYVHALLLYHPDHAQASIKILYELVREIRPLPLVQMYLKRATTLGALILNQILRLCDSETKARFFIHVFQEDLQLDPGQIRKRDWTSTTNCSPERRSSLTEEADLGLEYPDLVPA